MTTVVRQSRNSKRTDFICNGYMILMQNNQESSELLPEHDDSGICQWHLLNCIEEQDCCNGTQETTKHQIKTFISGTKETCPGGADK